MIYRYVDMPTALCSRCPLAGRTAINLTRSADVANYPFYCRLWGRRRGIFTSVIVEMTVANQSEDICLWRQSFFSNGSKTHSDSIWMSDVYGADKRLYNSTFYFHLFVIATVIDFLFDSICQSPNNLLQSLIIIKTVLYMVRL